MDKRPLEPLIGSEERFRPVNERRDGDGMKPSIIDYIMNFPIAKELTLDAMMALQLRVEIEKLQKERDEAIDEAHEIMMQYALDRR